LKSVFNFSLGSLAKPKKLKNARVAVFGTWQKSSGSMGHSASRCANGCKKVVRIVFSIFFLFLSEFAKHSDGPSDLTNEVHLPKPNLVMAMAK